MAKAKRTITPRPAGRLDQKLSQKAYHPPTRAEALDANASLHGTIPETARPENTYIFERSNPANGGRHK